MGYEQNTSMFTNKLARIGCGGGGVVMSRFPDERALLKCHQTSFRATYEDGLAGFKVLVTSTCVLNRCQFIALAIERELAHRTLQWNTNSWSNVKQRSVNTQLVN